METYKGKKIDDMTREELIAALKDVGTRYLREVDENIALFGRVTKAPTSR